MTGKKNVTARKKFEFLFSRLRFRSDGNRLFSPLANGIRAPSVPFQEHCDIANILKVKYGESTRINGDGVFIETYGNTAVSFYILRLSSNVLFVKYLLRVNSEKIIP